MSISVIDGRRGHRIRNFTRTYYEFFRVPPRSRLLFRLKRVAYLFDTCVMLFFILRSIRINLGLICPKCERYRRSFYTKANFKLANVPVYNP